MDEKKLLDNEQLKDVSGGSVTLEPGRQYSVYQVAYLYAMEGIRLHRTFDQTADWVRANWDEVNQQLIACGNNDVYIQNFIDLISRALVEHSLKFWPPV